MNKNAIWADFVTTTNKKTMQQLAKKHRFRVCWFIILRKPGTWLPSSAKAITEACMQYYLLCFAFLGAFSFACHARAWDGFDADSADLVEILPDADLSPGDTITLNNRDADSMQEGTVESVKRNRRTVEVVVRLQNGELHTFVMESR